MVGFLTWCRYFARRVEYAYQQTRMDYEIRLIKGDEIMGAFATNLFKGRLTFLYSDKGEEKYGMLGGTLLVRKIPDVDPTKVYIGDAVLAREPYPRDFTVILVRRLAAVGGYEMVSTNPREDPFVLEKDDCWVLNENKGPKEAFDSRTFGPTYIKGIRGRVIYCLRSSEDHGPVKNSCQGSKKDSAILEVELDLDEMAKYQKPPRED